LYLLLNFSFQFKVPGVVKVFNVVYVYVGFLIWFKTNHVQINKSTPLLSIFLLKTAVNQSKDSLKNTVWNHWCFWRHKLPSNQSSQWLQVSGGVMSAFSICGYMNMQTSPEFAYSYNRIY